MPFKEEEDSKLVSMPGLLFVDEKTFLNNNDNMTRFHYFLNKFLD
jgi:hypothetical protein